MTTIVVEQRIPCSRERIWQAVATAAGLASWQADRVSGLVARGQSLHQGWPALGISITVKVVEVQPERLLVFALGSNRLVVQVETGGVRLEHQGLTAGDEAEGTEASWRTSLATLTHYLAHHDGQRRQVRWVGGKVATTAQIVHAFATESQLLASWLARHGAIGEVGEPVRLELAWGEPLTGRVLANAPGRDLAFSWHEQDESVLVVRTLPSPVGGAQRMVLLSWSRWSVVGDDTRVLAELQAATDRLCRVLRRGGSD